MRLPKKPLESGEMPGSTLRSSVDTRLEARPPGSRCAATSRPCEIATRAGVDVHSAACVSRERRCPFFDGCLKQRNRAEAAAADVVIAAYDALYSGFAIDPYSISLILIDEGCWPRAVEHIKGPAVETLATNSWVGPKPRRRLSVEAAAAATADLLDLRHLARKALVANGPGSLRRKAIIGSGLSERDCHDAIELEKRRLRDTGLPRACPGRSGNGRSTRRRRTSERWPTSLSGVPSLGSWRPSGNRTVVCGSCRPTAKPDTTARR